MGELFFIAAFDKGSYCLPVTGGKNPLMRRKKREGKRRADVNLRKREKIIIIATRGARISGELLRA